METIGDVSASAPAGSGSQRAELLLQSMHGVLSHDLPNQLVVILSLIALLELEEGNRLGREGREQLRRLGLAARKASSQVHFLQEMARLRRHQEPVESLDPKYLLREVQARLTHRFPRLQGIHRTAVDIDRLRACRRSLPHALELAAGRGIAPEATGQVEWEWGFRPGTAGPEIHCRRRAAVHPAPSAVQPEMDLDCLLARELAATCGGRMRWEQESGEVVLCLILPESEPHG